MMMQLIVRQKKGQLKSNLNNIFNFLITFLFVFCLKKKCRYDVKVIIIIE